jgi:Flp pilus assembly protein protease CpaA
MRLLLAVIFVVLTLGAYQDIRFKRIQNRLVVGGYVAGLVIFLLLVAIKAISVEYLFSVLVNAAVALVAAYILWLVKIWPPGDAKFFAMLSFLLPLEYYNNSYLPVFPAFSLLVNIFVISFLVIVCQSIYFILPVAAGTAREFFLHLPARRALWQKKNIFFLKPSVVSVIYAVVVLQLVLSAVSAIPGLQWKALFGVGFYVGAFFLYPLALKMSARYVPSRPYLGYGAYILLITVLALKPASFFISASIALVMVLTDFYLKKSAVIEKKAADIEPGDMLVDAVQYGLTGYEETIGVTPADIAVLKKDPRVGGVHAILMQRSFPFSLYMVLAVILTMALKQNIINYIIRSMH